MNSRRKAAVALGLLGLVAVAASLAGDERQGIDVIRVDGQDPAGPVVVLHPGRAGITSSARAERLPSPQLLATSSQVVMLTDPGAGLRPDEMPDRCHEFLRDYVLALDSGELGVDRSTADEFVRRCELGSGRWSVTPQEYADVIVDAELGTYDFVGISYGALMVDALQRSANPPGRVTIIDPATDDDLLELLEGRIERTEAVAGPVPERRLVATEGSPGAPLAGRPELVELAYHVAGGSAAAREALEAGDVAGITSIIDGALFLYGDRQVDGGMLSYLETVCTVPGTAAGFGTLASHPAALVRLHAACALVEREEPRPRPVGVDCLVTNTSDTVADPELVDAAYEAVERVVADGEHGDMASCD